MDRSLLELVEDLGIKTREDWEYVVSPSGMVIQTVKGRPMSFCCCAIAFCSKKLEKGYNYFITEEGWLARRRRNSNEED